MTFTFEELNEIGNVSRQCGLDVGLLKNPTPRNISCRNILKNVAMIEEINIGGMMGNVQMSVDKKPFIEQGGMILEFPEIDFQIKSRTLRKIENLID